MTAVQLLTQLDTVGRQVLEYEEQISDLSNYEAHIEAVKSDLHKTLHDPHQRTDIDVALTTLKTAAAEYTKSASSEPPARLKKVIDDLSDIVTADDWRYLKQRPNPRTTIVESNKFQLKSAGLNRPANDPLGPTREILKKPIDSNFKDSLTGEIGKLVTDDLLEAYRTNAKDVIDELNDLEKQVAEFRQSKETLVREEIQPQIMLLQQELAKRSSGQEGTFTLVGWMMALLLSLFVMSIGARMAVAFRFQGTNYSGIIDEKTLIEFGGMAFILLTIIILGNTDKLDRQALGALLGTIAGYIFGKGIAVASAPHSTSNVLDARKNIRPTIKSISAAGKDVTIMGDGLSPAAIVILSLSGTQQVATDRAAKEIYSAGSTCLAHRLTLTLAAPVTSGAHCRAHLINPDGVDVEWEGKL